MSFNFVIPQFNINGAGTSPLQFFRKGFILNGTGGSQPSWKDIILHGNTALTLVNAKADGLNYLKLFGGTEQLAETYIDSVTLDGKCEQNGTPTPDNPIDIVCNNGVISYDSVNDTIIATGTTETITDNLGNVATAEMLLSVGNYKDTQEVLSGVVTSRIGYYVFDGTESFSTSTAYGKACLIVSAATTWQAELTEVLCTHFLGIGVPSTSTPVNTCFFNSSGHFYFRLEDNTVETLKAWLAQQYANGTPVIVFFVKRDSSIVPETVTPQILNKEPLTVTGSLSDLVATVVSSTHTTPTPTQPLQINCNNGVLKVNSQGQIYTDGTVETVQTRLKGLTPDEFFGAQATITKRVGLFSYEFSYSPASSATWNGIVKAGLNIIEGHKYYYCAEMSSSAQSILTIAFTNALESATRNKATVEPNTTYLLDKISTATTSNSNDNIYIRCGYTGLGDYTGSAYNIGLFDLTEMFGAGNEPTTTEQARQALFFGSATAEMLLKLFNKGGDSIYAQDVQNVTTGEVTRNVGIKVFDGTEEGWAKSNNSFSNTYICPDKIDAKKPMLCTHFAYNSGTTTTITDLKIGCSVNGTNVYFRYDNISTVEDWKTWLTNQYANGTPVIIVYPLATPTTESVAHQHLGIQAGTNVVEITQASINNLALEAKYKGTSEE